MRNNKDWIYRFSTPGKYDLAPSGTICCIFIDKKSFEIYCQISEEEDYPQWAFVGEYSEGLPKDYIESDIERMLKVEHNIEGVNKVVKKKLQFKGTYKNEHKQSNNSGKPD